MAGVWPGTRSGTMAGTRPLQVSVSYKLVQC